MSLAARVVAVLLVLCALAVWSAERGAKGGASAVPLQPDRGTERAPFVVTGEVVIKKNGVDADAETLERESKAHLDAALVKYTLWLAVGTGLLFLAAAIQAGLFVWQLRLIRRGEEQARAAAEAAKTSADAAKKNADAALLALRPWLSCRVEIVGPLTFDGHVNGMANSAVFRLRFTVKNFGKTPALNVTNFFPQFNFSSPQHKFSILKLQELAEGNRGLPVRNGGFMLPGGAPIQGDPGRILFPEEVWTEEIALPIDRREIEKACEDIRPSKLFSPELIVLITYSYPLAEVRASTGYIYQISKTNRTALQMDEVLRVDQMRIAIHDMLGGSAT